MSVEVWVCSWRLSLSWSLMTIKQSVGPTLRTIPDHGYFSLAKSDHPFLIINLDYVRLIWFARFKAAKSAASGEPDNQFSFSEDTA